MLDSRRIIFSLAISLIATMAVTMAAATPQDDASRLLESWQASRVTKQAALGHGEIQQIELLFARSLDRPIEATTAEEWKELGFVIEPLRLGRDTCHLLTEAATARLGRGMFLLCPTRANASVLLIPHGFHDRFTADIGALLAAEGRFKAIAWNTTPRHATADHEAGLDRRDSPPLSESYFTALARAASVLGLPGPMIQLHGFAVYRRLTEAGKNARAILSSSTNTPHRSTLRIAACLEPRLGEGLLIYPTEVNELGGTMNSVAAELRHWGRNDFLHLELSFALRKRLLDDPKARTALIECFGGSLQ